MVKADSREKIIASFARWAAASAARQGCEVRGGAWYEHLDQVNVSSLLAITPPVSAVAFSTWHQTEVDRLKSSADVPVGWAAKMVNMLVKIHVYIALRGDPSLLLVIHPPIDNELVAAVQREFPLKGPERSANQEIRRLCSLGKPIKGVTSYSQYSEVIRGLTLASQRLGCTLFEIESLWTG